MASPPTSTSRLTFELPSGERIDSPQEWTPCHVVISVDSLDGVELYRGDQRLAVLQTKIDGASKIFAAWPRSGTGNYTLTLRGHDFEETVRCSVRPEKISEEAFETLLDDLQERLPATIAIALQRAGALTGLDITAPQETGLAEELNRLNRACHGTATHRGLITVLRAVARRPHHVLKTVDTWTRRERARRIDPTRLYQAFSRRENLDEQKLPLTVPEQEVQHSVDVYENRVLGTFYEQVSQRLRALQLAASAATPSIADQAGALLHELTIARRDARFLDDVGELAEPPSRLTMVLLKRPEYRAGLEGFIEFRRSAIVSLDEPALEAPLRELPKLYETWGTLEVIATLANLAQPLGYRVTQERLFRRSANQIWIEILRDGKPALILENANGTLVKLTPQRTYSSSGRALHSVSFAKRPDVAIEITTPDGREGIWIFDPKYKLESETGPSGDENAETLPGTPKPQDINAMHAYRDAIRNEHDERVVELAAILYPGQSVAYGHGLAAIQALPNSARQLDDELASVLERALLTRETPFGA